jgi:hypothetical protein
MEAWVINLGCLACGLVVGLIFGVSLMQDRARALEAHLASALTARNVLYGQNEALREYVEDRECLCLPAENGRDTETCDRCYALHRAGGASGR